MLKSKVFGENEFFEILNKIKNNCFDENKFMF